MTPIEQFPAAVFPLSSPEIPALHAQLLSGGWSAETSAYDAWSPERPSVGQCAVTALEVQRILGGELVRVTNFGESHYFNWTTVGVVDLTRDQFDVWEPTAPELRTREYVLSHPKTSNRYELLRINLAGRDEVLAAA
jgi:hypothetical protein